MYVAEYVTSLLRAVKLNYVQDRFLVDWLVDELVGTSDKSSLVFKLLFRVRGAADKERLCVFVSH